MFVSFFVRLQFVCLFVCFSSCVLKNVVIKKGRKEERHHHHPTTRSSTTHKKAAFFGEEKVVLLFFGRSRSLGCLRLNARGRSDYFLGRLAHGGVRGVRPGTRRPRTHGGTTRVFSSLFRRRRFVSKRRIIHRSIDRSTVVVSRYWTPRACGRDHSPVARGTKNGNAGSSLASLARSQIILITFSSSFIIIIIIFIDRNKKRCARWNRSRLWKCWKNSLETWRKIRRRRNTDE